MKISKRNIEYRIFPKFISSLDLHNKNYLFQKHIVKKFQNCKKFEIEQKSDYYKFINTDIIGNQPIDFLEFGVYKGYSLSTWAKINNHPDSRFIGFDSFFGLPEYWNKTNPKNTFTTEGEIPVIDDKRVSFVKGLFQETLYKFLSDFTVKSRLVIHIDADLYSSTLFCLAHLDHLIKQDSLVLFDEFHDLQNEFLAFYDYTRSHNRKFTILARIYWSQVAVKFL